MRQLVLNRINELKEKERNFPKSIMRWKNFYFGNDHISEIKFEDLSDDELFNLFERLIFRYYKQM